MSRPSTLKTTISPALIGSSRKFVRNRRSPLWKAGSILPLGRNAKSHPISLDSQGELSIHEEYKSKHISERVNLHESSGRSGSYQPSHSGSLLTAHDDDIKRERKWFLLRLSMKRRAASPSYTLHYVDKEPGIMWTLWGESCQFLASKKKKKSLTSINTLVFSFRSIDLESWLIL